MCELEKQKNALIITDENAVLELAAASIIGDREEQQDCFGYSLKQEQGLIAVCDGMGGRSGGKRASRIAVKTIIADYECSECSFGITDWLLDHIKKLDRIVADLTDAEGTHIGAGSTIVTVVVDKDALFWASAGDSRAYLLRGTEFVQFTLDQNYKTVLEEKLRANQISKDEYDRESASGDILISYLGLGDISLIDHNETPLALHSGDVIIIMTDGLYKLMPERIIKAILTKFKDPSDAVLSLCRNAEVISSKHNSSSDNITIGIVKIK